MRAGGGTEPIPPQTIDPVCVTIPDRRALRFGLKKKQNKNCDQTFLNYKKQEETSEGKNLRIFFLRLKNSKKNQTCGDVNHSDHRDSFIQSYFEENCHSAQSRNSELCVLLPQPNCALSKPYVC